MGKYSMLSLLYLAICFVRTRIGYYPARLIRFPFDLRGGAGVTWGPGFTTGRNCRIECVKPDRSKPIIRIGSRVQINDNVHIVGALSVSIGDDVLIASKVFISDCSHGIYSGAESSSPDTNPQERPLKASPVIIGDRVWLGDNVVLMPGVSIGNGSIIGASSVVVRNIPQDCIAVGVPAKVVKIFSRSRGEWISAEKEN